MEKRKFESLSKEELAKFRKLMNLWLDKLHVGDIMLFPMNEEDQKYIDKDVNGRECFNSYKK